jgi:hypothetical protein
LSTPTPNQPPNRSQSQDRFTRRKKIGRRGETKKLLKKPSHSKPLRTFHPKLLKKCSNRSLKKRLLLLLA